MISWRIKYREANKRLLCLFRLVTQSLNKNNFRGVIFGFFSDESISLMSSQQSFTSCCFNESRMDEIASHSKSANSIDIIIFAFLYWVEPCLLIIFAIDLSPFHGVCIHPAISYTLWQTFCEVSHLNTCFHPCSHGLALVLATSFCYLISISHKTEYTAPISSVKSTMRLLFLIK